MTIMVRWDDKNELAALWKRAKALRPHLRKEQWYYEIFKMGLANESETLDIDENSGGGGCGANGEVTND